MKNLYEESLTDLSIISDWFLLLSNSESESCIMTTESRPVRLRIKHPSRAYDQIFITVRQLRVCWRGSLSLTRGRVCSLQSLLALASALILGSESSGTRDHILLSQIQDFHFRRLLRLTRLRWRYSTPPPHGISLEFTKCTAFYNFLAAPPWVPLLCFTNALSRKPCINSGQRFWVLQACSFAAKCVLTIVV
jgi:hypothetical protein